MVSATALALRLGISRDRLAHYEAGRTPLPYFVGRRVCLALDVNQRWLATGADPKSPYLEVDRFNEDLIPERATFPEGYGLYSECFEDTLDSIAEMLSCTPEAIEKAIGEGELPDAILPVGIDPFEGMLRAVVKAIQIRFHGLPDEKKPVMIGKLFSFLKRERVEERVKELVAEKVAAGLDRAMAEEVALRQVEHDAQIARKSVRRGRAAP